MKYYTDEDISPVVARILRNRGVDAVSVHEEGARALSDQEQLFRAAAMGCCVVTRNRDDFIELTEECFYAGLPPCGVLIVPAGVPLDAFAAIAGRIAQHAARFPGDLPPYTVSYL